MIFKPSHIACLIATKLPQRKVMNALTRILLNLFLIVTLIVSPVLLSAQVADDDYEDRSFFVEALSESKIKTSIHTVNDGAELMDYLLQEDTDMPYMLFLDLNMPRKNGIECLDEIRKTEKLREVIVAIYSTSSSEKDINATFIRGANVYIKKPNDFNELKQVLDKVVRAAYVYCEPPFNKSNFIFKI